MPNDIPYIGLPVNLRPGVAADIPALNAIAFAAKAHWGYSAAQLQAWREALTVRAETLAAHPLCVAEDEGQPVGFVQLATDTQPWELSAMWVNPSHMGRGIGRALLAWARQQAAAAGQQELAIDADPNAEGFYQTCGARRVGALAAPVAGDPARLRPQLRLRTVAT
jgi:GNAT superfamily N-acetyltransferase